MKKLEDRSINPILKRSVISAANALCKRLGDDWVTDIWENRAGFWMAAISKTSPQIRISGVKKRSRPNQKSSPSDTFKIDHYGIWVGEPGFLPGAQGSTYYSGKTLEQALCNVLTKHAFKIVPLKRPQHLSPITK